MIQQLTTAPVHNASVCLPLNNLLNFMVSNIPYNNSLVCLMGDLVQYFISSAYEKGFDQKVIVSESVSPTLKEQEFSFSFSNVFYSEKNIDFIIYKYVNEISIENTYYSAKKKVVITVRLAANKEDNKRSGITLINKIIEDKQASQWSKDTAKIMSCWVSDGALITSTRDEGSQNHVFTIHGPKTTIEAIKKFFSALDDANVHTATYPQADDFLVINKKEIIEKPSETVKPKNPRKKKDVLEIKITDQGNAGYFTLTKLAVSNIEIVDAGGLVVWIHHKDKEKSELKFSTKEEMLRARSRIVQFIKDHQV